MMGLKTFEIIPKLKATLRKAGYTEQKIAEYTRLGYKLISIMEQYQLESLTTDSINQLLFEFTYQGDNNKESAQMTSLLNKMEMILSNKEIHNRRHKTVKDTPLPGNIGEYAARFINHLQNIGYKKVTLTQYRRNLSVFSTEMNNQGLSIETIKPNNVLSFIAERESMPRQAKDAIKALLNYAYVQGLVNYELKSCLDNIHIRTKRKLPSFYTPEEVNLIEQSINRSTATGKRDYAMILLSSRLGLRVSDVCTLKFSNIDWDACTISLTQHKTGKPIILPLLEDVGVSIIDYIKNGRPESSSKYIFVSHSYPDKAVDCCLFTDRVGRYVKKSSVDIGDRHFGPHALRHSLATILMQGGTELPVISEALGHEYTSSTMRYINVDLNSLINCSLDVPLVDKKFYMQSGGRLYDKD